MIQVNYVPVLIIPPYTFSNGANLLASFYSEPYGRRSARRREVVVVISFTRKVINNVR